MPPSSRKIKDPSPPTPLDPKEIRQHVRLLIRHLASVHPRDTPRQTQVILNEIWRLVECARHAPWTADPQGLVRLFLHEHLFDDAIAVLATKQRYTLVAEVVEAALKEQTALEWVVQECRKQAEHIMNGAKASYYEGAAFWLRRARTAYHLLGQDEVWNAYLADLLERHKLKSKLVPLLTALLKEDQDGNYPLES
jgi:hypothetical protein